MRGECLWHMVRKHSMLWPARSEIDEWDFHGSHNERQFPKDKNHMRREGGAEIKRLTLMCVKRKLSKFHVTELIATSPWLQASSVVLPYINSSVGFQAALECASAISDMSLPSFQSNMRRKYPDIRTDSQLQLLPTCVVEIAM